MFPTSEHKGTKGVYYVHYSLEIFAEYINPNTTGAFGDKTTAGYNSFYEIQRF